MAGKNAPGMLDVLKSVLASAFGVQSHKNYHRDFTTGSLIPYIVVAVVFFMLFILGLVLLVNMVVTG